MYGSTPKKFFRCVADLKAQYGDRFKNISRGAVGLYSYLYDRMKVSLQQLLTGSRKFKIELNRNDLMALTERAAAVTGLPLPHESDSKPIEQMLG